MRHRKYGGGIQRPPGHVTGDVTSSIGQKWTYFQRRMGTPLVARYLHVYSLVYHRRQSEIARVRRTWWDPHQTQTAPRQIRTSPSKSAPNTHRSGLSRTYEISSRMPYFAIMYFSHYILKKSSIRPTLLYSCIHPHMMDRISNWYSD